MKKIEVGTEYKTRDGRKARIYAVDGRPMKPVQGAIYTDGTWDMCEWTLLGKYGGHEGRDLVSEWTEPKPRLKAWIIDHNDGDSDRSAFFFSEGFTPKGRWERAPWLDQPEEGE